MQPVSISLSLSLDEVNSILQIFGELPTKSGIYPLTMKIKEQAEAQLNAKEPVED